MHLPSAKHHFVQYAFSVEECKSFSIFNILREQCKLRLCSDLTQRLISLKISEKSFIVFKCFCIHLNIRSIIATQSKVCAVLVFVIFFSINKWQQQLIFSRFRCMFVWRYCSVWLLLLFLSLYLSHLIHMCIGFTNSKIDL